MTDIMTGPFETEAEVLALPVVRAVYAMPGRGGDPWQPDPGNVAILGAALAEAGVGLGAFDRKVLGWLAQWEPATVAVVCSWIGRAAGGWP